MTRKSLLTAAAAVLVLLVAVAWFARTPQRAPPPATAAAPPQTAALHAAYVGTEACKGCHAAEYQAWRGSHHELAMQEATEATVLGDFHDASFTHPGSNAHFFRKDGKFLVRTEGADGKLQDFEVRYTFGLYPLQQYLVPFADGRLQALTVAWDARPKAQGGQRWMTLYPHETLKAGDELHWTGLQQNWNYMCAECHSTDLRKNYDAAANSYHTTWKDLSVGCEACHGAGSAHLAWAHQPAAARAAGDGLLAHFDDRKGYSWILDPATGNSHRSPPRTNSYELEACGRCHARAAKIAEDWRPDTPLEDTHRVTLLEEGMYTADGQMQAEVYNYGSFLQSRMFAAGVTCSDCHDPHSGQLRVKDQEVCTLCHAASKYAVTAHHHHKEQSAESRCPACHMPERTYMVVDRRHDHSFRIPRPDESVTYGTPNACNDCHKDKGAAWAAQAVSSWYGHAPEGFQHYTAALYDARNQRAAAARELLALAADGASPAIARATALAELGADMDPATVAAARKALGSPDELVRRAAVELLGNADPPVRWPAVAPLLTDPVLAVRIAAAAELADAVPGDAPAEARQHLAAALAEYRAVQQLSADRPEAHLSLADLAARQGDATTARSEYQAALRLWPGFVPAYVNLADLCRAQGQDAEAEHWLTEARRIAPKNAAVALALGLLRARQHRTPEALTLLAEAVRYDPGNAHYAYVYGVGLYSTGHSAEGLKVLREAQARFPGNRALLLGLVSLLAESGDLDAARRYAEVFVALAPADPRGAQLLAQLHPHGP